MDFAPIVSRNSSTKPQKMSKTLNPTLYQRLDFEVWRQIHRLPDFFVKFWQERELKKTVLDAYNNIPLYKELLDKRGINPAQVLLKDLERLPLMSKKLFRQHPLEKWTRTAKTPPDHYTWRQTSGCTGEPFRFTLNNDFNLLKRFGSNKYATYYSLRYLIWKGVPLETFDKKLKIVKIATADPEDASLYIPVTDLREKTDEVLLKIKTFKPHFIYGRVTSVVELARLAESAALLINFPFAYVHGEKLTETQRVFIEQTFKCQAYNGYGLEEVGEIAVDCKFHDGMHIYEETCIFEILDDENRPVPDGEIGRVVITHFFNDMMPIIRYETTDYGRVSREKCNCGLSTPRLYIEGRVGLVINVCGKRIMPVEASSNMTKFHENVLRYQIVKVDDDLLEIRIIPTHNFNPAITEKIPEAYLKNLGIKVRVKIVNDLPYRASGKNYFFVDETVAGDPQKSHL